MRIKIGGGLLPLNVLVIVLIAAIIFAPSGVLHIILGLPFVLFFPGYVLALALFPKKEGISGIERVALSFGLSIAAVPLIGLVLNYTWWGITLESSLYSVTCFIFVTSIIAGVRRKRLSAWERLEIEFQLRVPGWGGRAWDKVLSVALVIAILGALGTLGYVIATPRVGERFTEFYILGPEGKATDYLEELRMGEVGKVMVGIINHEYQDEYYRVEIRSAGTLIGELGPVIIQHGQKWESEASFIPASVGDNQKVEFLLFKGEETEPCLAPLHLWVGVTE